MEESDDMQRRVWLRTDRPIVPMNAGMWTYLPELEATLHRGVHAVADNRRVGFYDIEIGSNWYYIHIPSRISGVYLVAAGSKPLTKPVCEERMLAGVGRR
jgi:hypothetical protein